MQVAVKRHIPTNAFVLSCLVAILLSLTNLGSTVAFYAITSLFVVSIVQCYMFSIGSVLYRRIFAPRTSPPARWSLDRFGLPMNVAAVVYTLYSFFWAFWPQYYHTSLADLNDYRLRGGCCLECAVLRVIGTQGISRAGDVGRRAEPRHEAMTGK